MLKQSIQRWSCAHGTGRGEYAGGHQLSRRDRGVPHRGQGVPRRDTAAWLEGHRRPRTRRRAGPSPGTGAAGWPSSRYLSLTWPKEYGGRGLTKLEQVVLVEELALAGVPSGGRSDTFGIKMLGNTLLRWGTEEQKRPLPPPHPQRRGHLVPGLLRAGRRLRPRLPADARGARRRRMGDQRPEDLDLAAPTTPTGSSCWPAPTPTRSKHRGISFLLVPLDQPGVEVRPITHDERAAASSTRSSSPTPARPPTTSSAASTAAGRWP